MLSERPSICAQKARAREVARLRALPASARIALALELGDALRAVVVKLAPNGTSGATAAPVDAPTS